MLLVITADDYGLTEGIARGVLRAHRDGVVTSTSVIALGPAFDTTVHWLADAPDLDVGLHLAAVGEDRPLLTRREIPTLVDGEGRLAPSWRQLLPRLLAHRVDPADLAREFAAQLARLHAVGVRPTHINTHQNLHLWPTVTRVVATLAGQHGIPTVRVPDAPRGALRLPVATLSGRLRRRVHGEGLVTTDACAGLWRAGHQHGATLERTLRDLADRRPATAELVVHPGEDGDPGRYRYDWSYDWALEVAALCQPETRSLIGELGFALGRHRDLA